MSEWGFGCAHDSAHKPSSSAQLLSVAYLMSPLLSCLTLGQHLVSPRRSPLPTRRGKSLDSERKIWEVMEHPASEGSLFGISAGTNE